MAKVATGLCVLPGTKSAAEAPHCCHYSKSFLGDLNLVVRITYRHQKAKSVNASLKVFYLFEFGHVCFFCLLSGCS